MPVFQRADTRGRQLWFYAALILLFALAAFSAFYKLDAAGVNNWDEARHGVNAYEMMKTGNAIVNDYRYKPDYWNLKPPLSFWAIMLGFRLFGTTVLALRFYAALSMFLTVVLAARFMYKRYGRMACLVTTALLACENTLYRYHFARNGDADALFGLLCTLCVLALFWSQENKKWLFLSGLSFALAFLDKSWHACILLAVAGLFLLGTRRLLHLGGRIWAGVLACAFLPIAAWAALRYRADGTKFFKGMIDRDLLARSSTPLEGHSGSVFYYLHITLIQNCLGILVLAALLYLGGYLLFRRGRMRWEKRTRGDVFLFALWILVPSLFFSAAATKYSWYIFPTVIPLCMVCGAACGHVWRQAGSARMRVAAVSMTAVAAAVVAFNAVGTISTIMGEQEPASQLFLRGPVAADAHGRTAYIVHADGGGLWQQSEIYVGEAYADLKCMDGGFSAFARNSDSVAVVDEQVYSKTGAVPGGVTVLAQKNGFLLLAHAGTGKTDKK